jgi:hypothetical protein
MSKVFFGRDWSINHKFNFYFRIFTLLIHQLTRLQNFPFDIQELSITLSSKLVKNQIKLVSNPKRFSFVKANAVNTFIDQQKWY